MKRVVIYTLITFIFPAFVSSCESNKNSSLYHPDLTWDTGDDKGGEDPMAETSTHVATYNLQAETGTR